MCIFRGTSVIALNNAPLGSHLNLSALDYFSHIKRDMKSLKQCTSKQNFFLSLKPDWTFFPHIFSDHTVYRLISIYLLDADPFELLKHYFYSHAFLFYVRAITQL